MKKSNPFFSKSTPLFLTVFLAVTFIIGSCSTSGSDNNGHPTTEPPKPTAVDSADSVPQDGILEAVTWNLEWFGSASKGPSDEELQAANTIHVVDSLNADLFSFQEVIGKDAIESFAKRMKGYRAIYDKTDNQGNAFVYNTNAIDSVSTGDLADQSSQAWAGRVPFYFSFNYKPGNGKESIEVYAVVLHAKAGAGQDDYNRRMDAAQDLYNYLTNEKPDAKIILLGDFNDETTTSIYEGHDSPYNFFVKDSTRYNVLTYSLSTDDKTSETNYQSVIDNIIISNEMVPYYLEGSTQVFIPSDDFISSYGSSTSDHYPVWAKFDMTR